MEENLSPIEKKALNDFLEFINQLRKENAEKQMTTRTAIKFLMARKFDVHRSLELYQSHEDTRLREGLVKFDPTNDPLKSELETGKFTILPIRDKNGSTIALFSAGKHIPTETSHQTTLQGVVYQLDSALDDYDTQRAGIVFIYNMTGSKYSHFDYELSQKILKLLKGAYPARLKKVLIVTAPLWFKAPFRILQLFIREKLRDRVHMVNYSQLVNHIPLEVIPVELGGKYKIDHKTWLEHCRKVHETDSGDLCPKVPSNCKLLLSSLNAGGADSRSQNSTANSSSSNGSSVNSSPLIGDSIKHSRNGSNGSEQPIFANCDSTSTTATIINGCSATPITVTNSTLIPKLSIIHTSNTSESNINSTVSELATSTSLGIDVLTIEDENEEIEDDIDGVSLEEFISNLNDKGRKGLYEEYYMIKMQPPDGTFEIARARANQSKNRYVDVLCYDHTRIKLPLSDPNDPYSDYINANYVDGYRQKRAFISTQGPLTKTFFDFWRCVWYNKSIVIVMTTRTMERCRVKCGQYWPLDEKTYCQIGNFCIINNNVEQEKDWVITNLTLANTETNEKRTIIHMQFSSWPDFGVPQSALAMLEFRTKVRDYQKQYLKTLEWKGHHLGPPIVVHCSAGIGRTGTFITIDISIQRLEAHGKIEIQRTVEKIRSQRAYSIQMPDQYIFCCMALIEFALCKGLLQNIDLSRFEEEQSDSDIEE